ncbi:MULTISPECIES: hypothetical protein [Halorussus]|uniref:hypothetical protein n=1 Tax=Halorussus TaxID=1070314 RepID=UPI001878D81A|nr:MULTISPECIES: hypothetical protein [Halorussus]
MTLELGPIRPRAKASVLWGVVGLLAFLVALQGYELATGYRYPVAVKAGVALAVGVGATGLSYALEGRLFT